MPKMKSHSGARKRIKVTGSGKMRREQSGMRHNFEHMPPTRKRRLRGTTEVSAGDRKKVRKLLGR